MKIEYKFNKSSESITCNVESVELIIHEVIDIKKVKVLY